MNELRPTVGIYTLGCKVNQYESEAIAECFEAEGFSVQEPTLRSDFYVINTCTVTAESDRKARQFIRRALRQNPSAHLLVTGCFSQTQPKAVAEIPGVDYVCGNAEKLSVVKKAKELLGKEKATPICNVCPPDAHGFEPMQISSFGRTRSYIKIEDGCESRCTYCIIPDARGKIRSKPQSEVLEEVKKLTAGGCKEVVLTGIETASYGKDLKDTDLSTLLARVDEIDGIGRVRLGSLDPSLMKQSFVNQISKLPSLCPHFHLSLQSGSDEILAAMKRKYNSKMALEGLERLRDAIPDVQFTTDVIVGFPGETEKRFEETLEFARKARFLRIHVFPYSKRAGTPAERMKNQISEEVKHERVRILSALEEEIRESILDGQPGKILPVLFETDEENFSVGHTPSFLEVSVPSERPLHGSVRNVRIIGHDKNRCFGELLPGEVEKT